MNSAELVLRENEHVYHGLVVEGSRTGEAAALADSFQINGHDDLMVASNILRHAKDRWKALEEQRTSVTGPLNEILRTVNGWFKPVQTGLVRVETTLKNKIAAYTLAQKAAQEAAMRAAAEAIQANNQMMASQQLAAMVPAPPPQGIAVREIWDFVIENEALVPNEYKIVDPAKIKAAIWYANTEKTPPLPIPGVRFFLRGSVTVR